MIGAQEIVVVIEYDDVTRKKLTTVLRHAGFIVHSESRGIGGVQLAERVEADLVVVGFGLPDIDGLETIRRIHAHLDAYVLALMNVEDEIDVVLAFDAGADGCTARPLREREFRARIDAFMRRKKSHERSKSAGQQQELPAILRHGDLQLNPTTWEVHLAGAPVMLTATEFSILQLLLQFPGRVFSKRDLAHRSNTPAHAGHHFVVDADGRSVEVHVANLRRKLGDSASSARWIETVRGVGYRLAPERQIPG